MDLRVKNNIFLKSLRVTDDNFDLNKHKDYSGYNKEIKHIKSNTFTQSMFMYDGKILIFDMDKMELEFIDDIEEYNQKITEFNNIWNK